MNKSKHFKVNVINKHTFFGDNGITTFFIGRGSRWGNPYTHLKVEDTKAEFQCESREEAIKKYELYFKDKFDNDKVFRSEFMSLVNMLVVYKEINLKCYCSPKKCHGDFLAKVLIKFAKHNSDKKT